MIKLGLGLMLVTAALAADYHHPIASASKYFSGPPTEFPIDYAEDGNTRDRGNLFYNFELIKRNLPSQIDQREENLGKYMYRPKMTTTPEPIVMEIPSQQVIPKTAHVDNYNYNPMYHAAPVNSMPPAPEVWPGPTATHPPQYANPAWNMPSQHAEHQYPWTQPAHQQAFVPEPNYHQENYEKHSAPEHYAPPTTTFAPYVEERQYVAPSTPQPRHPAFDYVSESAPRSRPSRPRNNGMRGNHKFHPSDIPTAPITPPPMMPTTTVGSARPLKGAPPPVPTLTPWYDGFGK